VWGVGGVGGGGGGGGVWSERLRAAWWQVSGTEMHV